MWLTHTHILEKGRAWTNKIWRIHTGTKNRSVSFCFAFVCPRETGSHSLAFIHVSRWCGCGWWIWWACGRHLAGEHGIEFPHETFEVVRIWIFWFVAKKKGLDAPVTCSRGFMDRGPWNFQQSWARIFWPSFPRQMAGEGCGCKGDDLETRKKIQSRPHQGGRNLSKTTPSEFSAGSHFFCAWNYGGGCSWTWDLDHSRMVQWRDFVAICCIKSIHETRGGRAHRQDSSRCGIWAELPPWYGCGSWWPQFFQCHVDLPWYCSVLSCWTFSNHFFGVVSCLCFFWGANRTKHAPIHANQDSPLTATSASADCSFVCKVCDFGLARVLEEGITTLLTSQIGTISHMPPELIKVDEKRLTKKADIYSMGILLYELVLGDIPYRGLSLPQVVLRVARDAKLELPPASDKLTKIFRVCTEIDAVQRPCAEEVLHMLCEWNVLSFLLTFFYCHQPNMAQRRRLSPKVMRSLQFSKT